VDRYSFLVRNFHPVLIARPLFEALLALHPDEGANRVIREWHSRTRFVEVADPGILVDVDDPETYSALNRKDPSLW
jgi:molybdenum cofactor cytidylyltransferase